jgi:hypothetical protein
VEEWISSHVMCSLEINSRLQIDVVYFDIVFVHKNIQHVGWFCIQTQHCIVSYSTNAFHLKAQLSEGLF